MSRMQKLGTNYDYVPESKQIGISGGIKSFWTNFERDPELKPKVIVVSQIPLVGFWEFKTNIDFEDLDLLWDERRRNRFLFQMWEIYRYRKVS